MLNKPDDPSPDVEFYLHSFRFLSGFRGSDGMGPSPLAYPDIAHYADRVGYTEPEDFFFLAEVLGRLDREYLKWAAEKK